MKNGKERKIHLKDCFTKYEMDELMDLKKKSICFRTERITKTTTSMKVYERKFDVVKRIEKVS